MDIKMIGSVEEFERRRLSEEHSTSLFADVQEVRVNLGLQFLIKITGRYKGEDIDRTHMFPIPIFPGKTPDEVKALRLEALTGYLDAIKEILNSELGEKR